jgi:hypothetical protein
MKVSDLIKLLSSMDPSKEVVFKHLFTSPPVIMKKIRVYAWDDRVVVDGYNQEPYNEGR